MSTLSERMITVGEIQDMMRATRTDFDELNPTEQGIMLSHIDTAIANDFLDEEYKRDPRKFCLRLGSMFSIDICICGILPEDADMKSPNVFDVPSKDVSVRRDMFSAMLAFIIGAKPSSRLWYVVVPVDVYIEHVRERCGDGVAGTLQKMLFWEVHDKRGTIEMIHNLKLISGAIFESVRRDIFERV